MSRRSVRRTPSAEPCDEPPTPLHPVPPPRRLLLRLLCVLWSLWFLYLCYVALFAR